MIDLISLFTTTINLTCIVRHDVYPLLCAPSQQARVQRGKEAEGIRRVRKPAVNSVVAVVFFLFLVIQFSPERAGHLHFFSDWVI